MKFASAVAAILLSFLIGPMAADFANAQHMRATSKWPRTCFEFCETRAAKGMKELKAMGNSYGWAITTCAQKCTVAREACERDPRECAKLQK